MTQVFRIERNSRSVIRSFTNPMPDGFLLAFGSARQVQDEISTWVNTVLPTPAMAAWACGPDVRSIAVDPDAFTPQHSTARLQTPISVSQRHEQTSAPRNSSTFRSHLRNLQSVTTNASPALSGVFTGIAQAENPHIVGSDRRAVFICRSSSLTAPDKNLSATILVVAT